jgi:predicted kinase
MKFSDYLSESINDRGIFKAVFFAGSPGAGKSYVSKQVTSGSVQPRLVNTDKAYEYLVHTAGAQFSGTADQYVDKAMQLTQAALVNYINGVLPLYIDGTSNSPSSLLQRMGILESFGYDVGMVFINTDLEVALQRAASRERFVPPEFIKQVHAKVNKNKSFYTSKFGSNFVEITNNGDLTDEVILSGYRKMSGFFESPIQSPIGQDLKERMMGDKQAYLAPNCFSIEQIQKKVSVWYNT